MLLLLLWIYLQLFHAHLLTLLPLLFRLLESKVVVIVALIVYFVLAVVVGVAAIVAFNTAVVVAKPSRY